MRKRVRRPSPAMVVAVAGLIAATSGDAVADRVKDVIGKDRVNSTSVKDRSLRLIDIKRSDRARLRGRPGRRGPAGAPGPGAFDQVFRKSTTFDVAIAPATQCPGTPAGSPCVQPITQFALGTVSCDPGKVAVGGGVTPDNIQFVDVSETHPTANGAGWAATVGNDDTSSAHKFEVTVLCVPGRTG